MELNGNINAWDLQRFGFGYISAIKKQLAAFKSCQQDPSTERTEQSFHLMHHALRMRRAIEAIKPFLEEVRSVSIVSAARAESVNELDVAKTGTPATMKSTAIAPDAKIIGTLVRMVAGSLNAMFDDSEMSSKPSAQSDAAREDIRSAIKTWLESEEGSRFKTEFGIHLDFSGENGSVFQFSGDDQRHFEATVSTPEGRTSAQYGLFGTQPPGLFTRLHAATTSAASRLEIDVGATGLFLDAFA